jgi:hypothetical protein
MNHQNVLAKLNQIVEQAQLTLHDPNRLAAERQKLIIALARFVSTEMASAGRLDVEASEAPPPLA